MVSPDAGSAQTRYDALAASREPYIQRARVCSKYTVPALFPDVNSRGTMRKLYIPYQSKGAQGVNTLSGKLLLTLLPPSAPFFRLVIDPGVEQALDKQSSPEGEPGPREKVEEQLSVGEQIVHREISIQKIRATYSEALKQLLVVGNVLLEKYSGKRSNGLKLYTLDQYVCKRDPEGNLIEFVIVEKISPDTITDPTLRSFVESQIEPTDIEGTKERSTDKAKTINLYTHYYLDDGMWVGYQEVMGREVPGSFSTTPMERLPFLALRWIRVDGEDYGRSHVEEFIGDLVQLEMLSKAIREGAQAAAHMLAVLKPGSQIKPKDLVKPSGSVVVGHPEDFEFKGMEHFANWQFAASTAQGIEQRLSEAFLINQPRDAERVTAEEIRMRAQELETALGGAFTTQAEEFQLPLVSLIMEELKEQKRFPDIPEDAVHPAIVTGLDALGRNQEYMRLRAAVAGLVQDFGPTAITYLNMQDYLSRTFAALGITSKGLVKTNEEVQAEQQQSQNNALAQKAVAPAINAANQQYTAATQPPEEGMSPNA